MKFIFQNKSAKNKSPIILADSQNETTNWLYKMKTNNEIIKYVMNKRCCYWSNSFCFKMQVSKQLKKQKNKVL